MGDARLPPPLALFSGGERAKVVFRKRLIVRFSHQERKFKRIDQLAQVLLGQAKAISDWRR